MPYLLQQLRSDDTYDEVPEGERRGAADGLSEMWLNRRDLLPRCLYGTLLPGILKGETNETKAGVLALFRRHAGLPSTPAQVSGGHSSSLLEPSEVVTKQSIATVRVLIEEYRGAHRLLPRTQETLFFEPEDARTMAMDLPQAVRKDCRGGREGTGFTYHRRSFTVAASHVVVAYLHRLIGSLA